MTDPEVENLKPNSESQSEFPKPPHTITEEDRKRIRTEHQVWLSYIGTAAIDGALIGLAVGLAIIFIDIHGIGTMLSRSDQQTGYSLLLLAGFSHTFGMVSAGMSIWLKTTRQERS